MDTTGTGVVTLSEFKAAIMERRSAIVQHQQEREERAKSVLTAEQTDMDADSTIPGTGPEGNGKRPDEKLEREGIGGGELVRNQERQKEGEKNGLAAVGGEDALTVASTVVDGEVVETGGEDEVRKYIGVSNKVPRPFFGKERPSAVASVWHSGPGFDAHGVQHST